MNAGTLVPCRTAATNQHDWPPSCPSPHTCKTRALPAARRVWVYTLVNTDYDGSKMLPHFLNYYHRHVSRRAGQGQPGQRAAAGRHVCILVRMHGAQHSKRTAFHSRATVLAGTQQPAKACLAARLLPLQGVTWRRFLVLLHHTPGKYSRRGLEDAMGVCSGYSIECRWAHCRVGGRCRVGRTVAAVDCAG